MSTNLDNVKIDESPIFPGTFPTEYDPHNYNVNNPPPPYEFLPKKAPQQRLLIAVMGPTGSGKSTLISKIAGREVNIGHSLQSCTADIEEIPCKVGDKYVILVDTPGFNDTNQKDRSDTDILANLADWMQESWSEDMLLSGIIYLHSINEARMTGSSITNLRMFRKLCGDKNLKNVILATTKWGITPEADALRREKELDSPEGFWGPYIAGGSKIRRFENTQASACALVEEILDIGRDRFVPKIQEEVIKGKTLVETDAGAYLNQALVELNKKHAEEMAALREEIELARRERNKMMEDALKREQKRLKEEIASREEAQWLINASKVELLERQIRELKSSSKTRPGKLPPNPLRFWHLRWRCLACKDEKTETEGEWTCPKCNVTQMNEQ